MLSSKPRHLTLLALLFSLVWHSAVADTLLQRVQEAQQHDANYQSALAAREAGQEKRVQGAALLRPTVALQGSATHADNQVDHPNLLFANNHGDYQRLGLQASQPLFNRDKWLSSDEADLQSQIADEQLRAAEQTLLLRVASAYFDVLAAQDVLDTLKAQQAATELSLAQAQKNFDVGRANITETNEAQARRDLILAEEVSAQSDLAIKRSTLRRVSGSDGSPLARLNTASDLASLPLADLNTWQQQAAAQAPTVRLAHLQQHIANTEIQRSEADHYPTLDLVAGWNKNHDPHAISYAPGGTTSSIALQLTVPLYAGGAISSRQREAVQLAHKAEFDSSASELDTAEQVEQYHLSVQSGLAKIHAMQQAVLSNKTSLDSTELGRTVGVRTNVDVLNAQQQYFAALRDLAQAKYQTLLARLQLEYAAGQLNMDSIHRIDALLAQP